MDKLFCILLTITLSLAAASCRPPAPLEPGGEPDLVITDIHKIETTQGFIIGYTLENQGGADAGASTSRLSADGEVKATDTVPPLAKGGSAAREFADWVYNPVTPIIRVAADTGDTVTEADEDNNEDETSLGVEVVFDFIDEAQDALWQSGPPLTNIGFGIPGPAAFARYTNQGLEDASVPLKALETQPNPVAGGWITGTYTRFDTEDDTIRPGEHFFARVGFLEGALAVSVRFSVMLRPEGGPNTWIATVTKVYGTPLPTIDVPLDGFAGKRADFVLRVETTGPAGHDRATWAEARIIR